jgi:hypothetical protein
MRSTQGSMAFSLWMGMRKENFGELEILGGRDLDVASIAFNESHSDSCLLAELGLIGRTHLLRRTQDCLEKAHRESLRSLRLPQVFAINREKHDSLLRFLKRV